MQCWYVCTAFLIGERDDNKNRRGRESGDGLEMLAGRQLRMCGGWKGRTWLLKSLMSFKWRVMCQPFNCCWASDMISLLVKHKIQINLLSLEFGVLLNETRPAHASEGGCAVNLGPPILVDGRTDIRSCQQSSRHCQFVCFADDPPVN